MRAHPLLEVRLYGQIMLDELREGHPSFLKRVDVPERGVAWSDVHGRDREGDRATSSSRLWPATIEDEPTEQVRLVAFDPDGEDTGARRDRLRYSTRSARRGRIAASRRCSIGANARTSMATYVGDRKNRRHRPGRAFERTDYRFELVTDYGAFRDLQRHRLLTIEWQPLDRRPRLRRPRRHRRGRPGRTLRGVAAPFGRPLLRPAP